MRKENGNDLVDVGLGEIWTIDFDTQAGQGCRGACLGPFYRLESDIDIEYGYVVRPALNEHEPLE